MRREAVAFPTGEGFDLAGVVEGEGARGVVVCHPHPAFGGTMEVPLVVALASALARAGLVALRFDFRGAGGSSGAPTGGLVEERDVAAACAHLRGRGVAEVALAGYSFGALMAAKAIAAGTVPSSLGAGGSRRTVPSLLGAGGSRRTVPSSLGAGGSREDARAFVGIGFPTSIVGEHPDRVATVEAALARVPALLLSGDQDQFSDLARLRAYGGRARVVALPGQGHFFAGAALDDVVARAVAFLAE